MSEISELIAEIDVEDWLETEGIDYRKAGGAQFNLRDCPACGDSRWKVYLNRETGLGNCFHGECSAKFNLFSFARAHLATDSRGTILHFQGYAAGAGLTCFPVASPAPVEAPTDPDAWKLPQSVPLPINGKTHPFLVKRRITLATQARFGLRFSLDGSYAWLDDEGRKRHTDFSQRIIIPVEDLDGVVKTFQGRDVTGEAEQRYLFPMGLLGTGHLLYGARAVRGRKHLVISEGPFDVMATHQAIDGMPEFRDYGVIGSFGLSIGSGDDEGDDQLGRLRQLRREGTTELTFLWDGEHGAFKQAVRYGQELRAEGFKVRIGMMPEGKDPADVSTEVVREAIRNAVPLTDLSFLRFSLWNPYAE